MKIWIKSSVVILLMCIPSVSVLSLLLSTHQTSQALLLVLVGVYRPSWGSVGPQGQPADDQTAQGHYTAL